MSWEALRSLKTIWSATSKSRSLMGRLRSSAKVPVQEDLARCLVRYFLQAATSFSLGLGGVVLEGEEDVVDEHRVFLAAGLRRWAG